MIRGLLLSSGLSEDLSGAVVKAAEPAIRRVEEGAKKRVTRKARQGRNKMKRALKEANRRARLKSGKLRSGWSQAKVMKLAHKLARRM